MSGARVRVKICGVTNREDALAAIDAGADALGFNLYAGSKRALMLDREAAWIAALPPFVTRVAVLVNAPLDEALRVAAHPAIHLVQFHGDEDADYCARFATAAGRAFVKAIRLRSEASVASVASVASAASFSTSHVLLDADAGAAFGGTGQSIDLALAAEMRARHPALAIILAGGLRAENVAEAIRAVRPFAVDVASGVESSNEPRRKDRERMEAFVRAVAAA